MFFKDTPFPIDLAFKNNTVVLVKLHDPDPSNVFINLECQDVLFTDVCKIFKFFQRTELSSNQDWIGNIRLLSKLNYLDRSVYQFLAIARVKNY